jgi:anti-anti-sigma factor
MGELRIDEFDTTEVDAARRVELTGAIDGRSITDFTDFVDRLYEGGTRWFLVDMSGIKYVNSTGLGSLVKYADQFRARGGGMVLFEVPPKVKVIIKMLGLDTFFPIRTSFAEAIEEARSGTDSGPSDGAASAPEFRDRAEHSPMPSPPSPPTSLSGRANVEALRAGENNVNTNNGSSELLEEQRRTNRLLKGVILELRRLSELLEEDDEG